MSGNENNTLHATYSDDRPQAPRSSTTINASIADLHITDTSRHVISSNSGTSEVEVNLDSFLKKIESSINQSVLDVMKQVDQRNQDLIKSIYEKEFNKISSVELECIRSLIQIYERIRKINNKFNEEDFPEMKSYNNLEKRIEKMIMNLGVEMGHLNLNEKISDENCHLADVIFTRKSEEKEKWNSISDLDSKYYYIYKGNVVEKQKVAIYHENDSH